MDVYVYGFRYIILIDICGFAHFYCDLRLRDTRVQICTFDVIKRPEIHKLKIDKETKLKTLSKPQQRNFLK